MFLLFFFKNELLGVFLMTRVQYTFNTIYNIQYTIYNIQYTIYTLHYTLYTTSIDYILYTIHFTLYIIYYTQFSPTLIAYVCLIRSLICYLISPCLTAIFFCLSPSSLALYHTMAAVSCGRHED